MTDSCKGRKKRKFTISASLKGVEIAEKALVRLGFDSKMNFAESQLLARNTVTKFFQHELIQLDSFKRICEALKLNWREVAGITEEKSEQLEIKDSSSPDAHEGVEPVQTLRRQVTVIDRQSKKVEALIVLEGNINSVQNLKIIESILREYSGNTIEINDIKEGSIKLFIEGSPEDIERLVSCIKSGELKKVSSFPVKDIQVLSQSSDDDESNELDDKWRLVQEIVSQPVKGRKLSDADLSDADLSRAILSDADLKGANLSDADLIGVNLRGANLSGANLSSANLSDADLSRAMLFSANLSGANLSDADLIGTNLFDANLSGANLSSANLSDADLSRAMLFSANLSGAIVANALFGRSLGLTEYIKHNLEQRGAIFGDRPPVPVS